MLRKGGRRLEREEEGVGDVPSRYPQKVVSLAVALRSSDSTFSGVHFRERILLTVSHSNGWDGT